MFLGLFKCRVATWQKCRPFVNISALSPCVGLLLHVLVDSKIARASSGKSTLSLLLLQDRCQFPERCVQAERPWTSQAAHCMAEKFPGGEESKGVYRALTTRRVQGSNCAYLYPKISVLSSGQDIAVQMNRCQWECCAGWVAGL